jgi:iron complex transport system permease protein
MMFGATMMGWGKYVVIGSAFLFGLGTLFLIYGVSRRRGITSETVILCGVCLMYLFLALSSTLSVASGGVGAPLLLTGNLTESSWGSVVATLALLFILVPLPLKYSWDLNALSLGDEVALSVGVNLKRVRVVCMVLSTLIVSGIVCFTGVIGFVCLIAPYLARMMMGNDHRFIFPCSALIGALLLVATDTLARTVVPPIEIPAGLLITIIGVPFLLYLVLGRRGYEA